MNRRAFMAAITGAAVAPKPKLPQFEESPPQNFPAVNWPSGTLVFHRNAIVLAWPAIPGISQKVTGTFINAKLEIEARS